MGKSDIYEPEATKCYKPNLLPDHHHIPVVGL